MPDSRRHASSNDATRNSPGTTQTGRCIRLGGGAANPGPTYLSAAGPFSKSGTTYELFNAGNPHDLTGKVLVFDQ